MIQLQSNVLFKYVLNIKIAFNVKWDYILIYLVLCRWNLVPTKILKLSNFKVLG